MTVIAVGVLLLDGVLLGLAGLWAGRVALIVAGVLLILLAGGVYQLWRRQQRTLSEIEAARAEVRDEAIALRALLREKDPGLRAEERAERTED